MRAERDCGPSPGRDSLVLELDQLTKGVEAAPLASARVHALAVSLHAARESFEREQWRAGISQLGAFKNKVRAQITPLGSSLAEQWIGAAQNIIDRAQGQGQ